MIWGKYTRLLLGLDINGVDGISSEANPLWLVASLVVVASEEAETVNLFGRCVAGHFVEDVVGI